VVSADVGNTAVLGSDTFIYVPDSAEVAVMAAQPTEPSTFDLWVDSDNGNVWAKNAGVWQQIQVQSPAFAHETPAFSTTAHFGSSALAPANELGIFLPPYGAVRIGVKNSNPVEFFELDPTNTTPEGAFAGFRKTGSTISGFKLGDSTTPGWKSIERIGGTAGQWGIHDVNGAIRFTSTTGFTFGLPSDDVLSIEVDKVRVSQPVEMASNLNVLGSAGLSVFASLTVGQGATVGANVHSTAGRLLADGAPENGTYAGAQIALNPPDRDSFIGLRGGNGGGTAAVQLMCRAAEGVAVGTLSGDGNVWAPMLASAFTVQSTAAVKTDIRPLNDVVHPAGTQDPMSDTVPVPDIMALRPVAFRPSEYPTGTTEPPLVLNEQRERIGLIAEEVELVMPSAVRRNLDGTAFGIDYDQVFVALLDHVQRLTAELTRLRTELAGDMPGGNEPLPEVEP
jgi:hypothetical protein